MSRLIASPHPFKAEHVTTIAPDGLTILELLEFVQADPVLADHAHIWIEDQYIPRHNWRLVRPNPGVTVTVRVVPHGGGGDKNPLRTVLLIAVIAASVIAAPYLGAALAGSLGAAGATAGSVAFAGVTYTALGGAIISITGTLLVNLIAPIRPPSLAALSGTGGQRESPALSIEGARNAVSPFGTIPVVLGTHRQVPPLGAQSFTEIVGDESYLRMLVVWGYGPLKIEDIRIGETLLSEFDGVQIETREGRPDDEPVTLYPDTVSEEPISILLDEVSGWRVRSADVNADELNVDISFPSGLTQFNDNGDRTAATVEMQIQYREIGTADWLVPQFTATTVQSDSVTTDTIKIAHARSTAIRHGFRWSTPSRGNYEIRLRRITPDNTNSQRFDILTWSAIRTITNEYPIRFDHPLAVTALVIKASGQLNRTIDELNATVSSYVSSYYDQTFDMMTGVLPDGVTLERPDAGFNGTCIDQTNVMQYATENEPRWQYGSHRFNALTHSNGFDQSAWEIRPNVVMTPGAADGPGGEPGAAWLYELNGSDDRGLINDGMFTLRDDRAITGSLWVYPLSGLTWAVRNRKNGAGAGGPTVFQVLPLNQWTLISVTDEAGEFQAGDIVGLSFIGQTTGHRCYIYNAQSEFGTTATGSIVTGDDPAFAGELEGLLVEPERTNYLARSIRLDASEWVKQAGVTVVPDVADGPDGVLALDEYQYSGSGARSLRQDTFGNVAGKTVAVSLYARGPGDPANNFRIGVRHDGSVLTNIILQELPPYLERLSATYDFGSESSTDFGLNIQSQTVNARTGYEMGYVQMEIISDDDPRASSLIVTGPASRTRAADSLILPVPSGTYDITVTRADGVTTMPGVMVTGDAWSVPASTSPLQSVHVVGRASEVVSSNPADLYLHVLTGNANARSLPPDRIDIDRINDWGIFCTENGFEFNMIRDYKASVWDTLADVASAGRGSPSQSDGKWSVIYDYHQTIPVQHFTPRNSWGFEAEKAFPDQPDAFRVRFTNREQGWRQDELIVYADGHDQTTAVNFDGLDTIGITDPDHVWKFARFALAQGKLRPERWTFNVDFEHIVARRGDLVLITHDVLLVGLTSGRIKEVITSGEPPMITGMTVDETLRMEPDKDYGVSIRTVDDVKSAHQVVTSAGDQTTVTFMTPIDLINAPEVGDLFGFGLLDRETIEGLVLSIEPTTELAARLTCIPASSAVYTSDTGPIPEYDSVLTPQAGVPDALITAIRTDESVIQLGSGNTLIPHVAITVLTPLTFLPVTLDIQTRVSGTGEMFYDAAVVVVQGGDYLISDVEQNISYDFRVRWRAPGYQPGQWTVQSNVRVIGTSNPPGALINPTISVFGGSALIRWDRPQELDVRFGGEVRFRHSPLADLDPNLWSSTTSIGTTAKGDALIAVLPLKSGTYMARVFDRGGRPSDVIALSTKQASVLDFAMVDMITESPLFPGVKENCVEDSGTLKLDGVGLIDDIPDFDAIDHIDTYGGVDLEGLYTFSGGLDLGSVRRIRLTSTIDATSVNVLDEIDDRDSLIDSWEDFDGMVQAVADARVHVRATDDDPNGATVTWGIWNDLDSAEFEARGFQFRVRLTTGDPTYNIVIKTLSVIAEEI